MRILLTTDTIGGIWTFTKELSAGLLHRGHAVALVSFGRALSPEQASWCRSMTGQHGRAFQFEASTAPLEWMRSNRSAYTEAEPLLQRTIARFRPDLLHTNQFCFGNLPIDVPRLVTAHSDVLSWAAACLPVGLAPSTWLDQYRSLVQAGLDGADAVVAPTRWMLDALAGHFDVLASTHVIANGRKLPASGVREAQQLQAVSVGRLWDEAKNLGLLTRIDPPLPIFVAGERQHEGFSAPQHLGSVTLLGSLPEAELLRLFRKSSIYIASSIYEPFGLAPLEAALCGCAVVANDLLSLREVWGDAALYFQDPDSLVHLLRHLQSSPALLLRAQQNAGRRALQLSASRMTDAYVRLYTGMLAPGKQASKPVRELVSDAV